MTRYSREDLLQLAPLHAIGATTPEEAEALESAMAKDLALSAEVAAFRDVTARLGATEAVEPSAGLREQLLARARQSLPRARSAAVTAPIAVAPRGSRWLSFAMAASLLLAATSSMIAVQARRDVESLRNANIALAEQLEGRQRTLNAVLEGEQALRLVQVSTPEGVAGPGIQFFWDTRRARAVVHVFRLRPAPNGSDYQLWALADGKPVSLAVFNSDSGGHAVIDLPMLPIGVSGVSAVLVSLEPRGGSPLPTTAPFMAGNIAGN